MEHGNRDLKGIGKSISDYLGISTRPVGVKVCLEGQEVVGYAPSEKPLAFCRYVREAAQGKDFLIKMPDLDCVNAEITLGFRAPTYVNIEPRIKAKAAAVRIGPLHDCDVVLFVLSPEQIMTVAVLLGGIEASFKGEMGVCGEAMARVYESGKPNVTFLCNGARLNGGFEANELVLALPYKVLLELPPKMTKFASLGKKARDGLAQMLLRIR